MIVVLSAWSYPNSIETDNKFFENIGFITIASAEPNYQCDGRKYCSQMTSCEEAKYFLKNCPDPRMDGDGDGIPCERQWCGH